jgi:hypothetical protein
VLFREMNVEIMTVMRDHVQPDCQKGPIRQAPEIAATLESFRRHRET